MSCWSRFRLLLAACLLLPIPLAKADVERIEIRERRTVLDAQPFGDAGPYEKLSGAIHFAWDPANPANKAIVDLDLAPTGEDGLVRASANFMVLQPVDSDRRAGVGLFEVSNRGGKASLSYFNRARGATDPTDQSHFGDGLLMRLGLTVVWVGWQWDVPAAESLDRPSRLRIEAPIAERAAPGLVRSDWVIDEPAGELPLGHRGHTAYLPSAPDDPRNVLTVRDGRLGDRRVVPRDTWRFTNLTPTADGVGDPLVALDGGFDLGKIYEHVYVAEKPRVSGVGPAAIRDIVAFAKHDPDCPFPVSSGIAFGVSQTGRFLRTFLYQGFNADEHGRRAYDGMLIHTAGAGRGSFNHRFAQPSRDAHRYSAFFYPTDIFPFTSRRQHDPVANRADGLMARTRPEHRPLTFFTNTGYEYWGRAAALIHVSPDGTQDVEPLETERIYHLASAQHFVGRGGRPIQGSAILSNPLDFLVIERALLVRLIEWVQHGQLPPPSRYPRLDDGSLVAIDAWSFPSIPEVSAPTVAQEAYRADYGDRWGDGLGGVTGGGVIDNQPPRLGPRFPVLVPAVDEFGNEIAGVRSVEILAPVATYTPWSLRIGLPGPQSELRDFVGMRIPLPSTRAEGDARPGIGELYGSKEDYAEKAAMAAERLVREGFLLEEDLERVLEAARGRWP